MTGSEATKNKVRDWIERKFDKLHKITDKLPLSILDGILHGTSRGIINFLTDNHPENKQETKCPSNQIIRPFKGIIKPSYEKTCPNKGIIIPSYEKVCPNKGIIIPSYEKTADCCEEIINFFKIFEITDQWKEKYPIRFNIFYQESLRCKTLEEMFEKLIKGWEIKHKDLGCVIFKIDESLKEKYTHLLKNQDELKVALEKQNSIIEKLSMNEDKFLTELDLINQKLALINFNMNKVLTDEIKNFVLEFNKEIVEIKQLLKQISKDVGEIKLLTGDTNIKVTNIEEMTKKLCLQQEEIKNLILQALGERRTIC